MAEHWGAFVRFLQLLKFKKKKKKALDEDHPLLLLDVANEM